MNVGPTARGVFDSRANDRLEAMGDWMKYNSRSIYGCTQAPASFTAPENTILTYNPKTNRLYIHLINYPLERLVMKNMAGKIKYAQFLHDASEIRVIPPHWSGFDDTGKDDLIMAVPVIQPPVTIPVIEIALK